jgi:cytochrome bd-type quinol oxidase subunit 2
MKDMRSLSHEGQASARAAELSLAPFAAFPNCYSTLFSGFYLGLALLLAGRVARGVALQFRSKAAHPHWGKLSA